MGVEFWVGLGLRVGVDLGGMCLGLGVFLGLGVVLGVGVVLGLGVDLGV